MAKNTASAAPKPSRRPPFGLGLFFVLILLSSVGLSAPLKVIDQTVAVVGKSPLTARDVDVEYVLDRLLKGRKTKASTLPRHHLDRFKKIRLALVHRQLILNYLNKTGLFASVSEKELSQSEKLIAKGFSNRAALFAYLRKWEISDPELKALLSNRLRSRRFMQQHIPFRIRLTDKAVRKHYESHQTRRFLGKSFSDVEPIVREDLRREAVKKEFETWLEAETRRTEVVLLPVLTEAAGPNR